MTAALPEIRLRTRIAPAELDEKVGKILAPSDVNVLLVGDCRVLKPDGSLLAIYRRGIVPEPMREQAHAILTTIRGTTDTRHLASGSPLYRDKNQNRSGKIMSSIIGNIESRPRQPFCRLTAWTGEHTAEFAELYPYFGFLSEKFAENVPDRYAAQLRQVRATDPSWVIPGTAFSTITVNNTYPTGVHTDKGDLAEGFSVLSTLRRGEYTGGWLTFPEFRVAVDMQDGDLLLMDAHEWHGNVGMNLTEGAERISVVCYYRTEIVNCKTPLEEYETGKLRMGGVLDSEEGHVIGKAAVARAGSGK